MPTTSSDHEPRRDRTGGPPTAATCRPCRRRGRAQSGRRTTRPPRSTSAAGFPPVSNETSEIDLSGGWPQHLKVPPPPPPSSPADGPRLGVDVGTVRVGLAMSDPTGHARQPAGDAASGPRTSRDLDRLAALVVEHEVTEVVVGEPRHLSGASGASARGRRRLRSGTGRPDRRTCRFTLIDERLSTVTAASHLRDGGIDSRKQRPVIDQAAAVVILPVISTRRRSRVVTGTRRSGRGGGDTPRPSTARPAYPSRAGTRSARSSLARRRAAPAGYESPRYEPSRSSPPASPPLSGPRPPRRPRRAELPRHSLEAAERATSGIRRSGLRRPLRRRDRPRGRASWRGAGDGPPTHRATACPRGTAATTARVRPTRRRSTSRHRAPLRAAPAPPRGCVGPPLAAPGRSGRRRDRRQLPRARLARTTTATPPTPTRSTRTGTTTTRPAASRSSATTSRTSAAAAAACSGATGTAPTGTRSSTTTSTTTTTRPRRGLRRRAPRRRARRRALRRRPGAPRPGRRRDPHQALRPAQRSPSPSPSRGGAVLAAGAGRRSSSASSSAARQLLNLINPSSQDFTGQGSGEVEIRVREGDTLSDIARTLVDAGVIASIGPFIDAAEAHPDATGIQPGVYSLRAGDERSGRAGPDARPGRAPGLPGHRARGADRRRHARPARRRAPGSRSRSSRPRPPTPPRWACRPGPTARSRASCSRPPTTSSRTPRRRTSCTRWSPVPCRRSPTCRSRPRASRRC